MTNLRVVFAAVFVAGLHLPGWSFEPNDPYFDPFTFGTESEISPGQWHLMNQMPVSSENAGLDVNIIGAWSQGWTGSGVTIAIIDDGTQGDHPDLIGNFTNAYSWGFGKDQATNLAESYRGGPVENGIATAGDNHGTAVAGVAAARGGNGIGVTGAAPHANLAAIRYLGVVDPVRSDDQVHSAAILFQGQLDAQGNPDPFSPFQGPTPVRVKNHSYGPEFGYILFDVIPAMEESAGKGVLHVWSAGNQRGEWGTADSNKIFELTLPETIPVAALGSDGTFSDYSSYGANVFITAPSNDFPGYGITTTDRTGPDNGYNKNPEEADPAFDTPEGYNYTGTFGGTSSAAPLVAGIMALGVEANPDMDVRMAKHLLVQTSRVVDADDDSETGGWVVNGAGNAFNSNYGFGLIDAGAFTLAATQVDHLTPHTEHYTDKLIVNRSFSLESTDTLVESFSLWVDPDNKQPLEGVEVGFSITDLMDDWTLYESGTGTIAGDLSGWLTSPMGTRHELFFNDRFIDPEKWETQRDSDLEKIDWVFLSNAYWGEDPDGLWTLELVNSTGNPLSGVWENFDFTANMGELQLIPEPTTMALLLMCTVVLTRLHRRKRFVSRTAGPA